MTRPRDWAEAIERIRGLFSKWHPTDLAELVRLAALMPKGDCATWPECRCGKSWAFWDEETKRMAAPPPSGEPVTREELQWAVTSIVQMLDCVVVHCPDPEFREQAAKQWGRVMALAQKEKL